MWVKYGDYEFESNDVAALTYQEPIPAFDTGGGLMTGAKPEGYRVNLRGVFDCYIFITVEDRLDLLRIMKLSA